MRSFADVSADSYYAKAVAWAVENGITTGTAEGTFRPSTDPMEEIESAWYTRAQVRALHETDLFGSWALAYSWMFANGCLPGV